MHHDMPFLFLAADRDLPGMVLHYDARLVLLSWLVACVAAILALQQTDMATRIQRRSLRLGMVLSCAIVLGIGIWSMHFIGMLAVRLCTAVHYDGVLTAISLLPGLTAAYLALTLLVQEEPRGRRLLLAAVAIGSGIGAMHYLGMAAMRMPTELRYDPIWFILSLLVAVALALLALWVRFESVRRFGLSRRTGLFWGGIILGSAISGMHYTAMRAALFIGGVGNSAGQHDDRVDLALVIGLTALGIALFVFALNRLIQYMLSTQALAHSRRRMQAMNDAAVDTVLAVSDTGLIESANAAITRLLGWQQSEVIGKSLTLLLPQGLEHLSTFMMTQDGRSEQQVLETCGLHRDGHRLPLRLAIGSVWLDGFRFFALHLADLSERKAFEQALLQRDSRIATLLRNSPGVIFRLQRDEASGRLRYDFVSKAITRLCGLSAEALQEQAERYEALVARSDHLRLLRRRQGEDGQTSYSLEYRLQLDSQRIVWVSETGDLSRDSAGRVSSIEGVLLDITEAKARTAEFESVYAAIQRGTMLLELDIDGHIIAANDSCLQLFGYQRDELIGQHHALLCFPEDVLQTAYVQHWQALRTGQFLRGEYRRRARDGHEIWMQASYTPVLDTEGRPQRVIKLITDLSERYRMESELRLAKEKAEQAAAVKATFLANMSHEIRTPLNAVIGFTEVLQETPLSRSQHDYLQTIMRSSRTLLQLLNDILDSAKLESGAMELEQTAFSLRQMASDLVATFSLIAMNKNITVELNYAQDCPECFLGDALRLNQILSNLLSNAVKFTAHGQVKLIIQSVDGELLCAVSDTGIGIAADRLELIFEQFAQADASMTRRFGGTGLGTAIAKKLTELMHGEITVSSTLGQGSCFQVRLPLPACPCLDTAEAATTQQLARLPALHILVADDVPQNRQLMQIQLCRLGHRVTLVEDGEQAIAACARQHFDLVLMDVHMPVCDGLTATRKIHRTNQAEGRQPLPIIALTASVQASERQLAVDAGMAGFALKPVDMAALIAEIERVLGHDSGYTAARGNTSDWARARQAWGNVELHHAAIARLLDDMQAFLGNTPATPPEAADLAHRWRGAALNLGLVPLAEICANIESSPRSDSLWQNLRQQVAELQVRFYPLAPPTLAVAAPGVYDAASGERLASHLRAGEIDETLLDQVCAGLDAARAARLRTHILHFDFDEALDLLADAATHLAQRQE